MGTDRLQAYDAIGSLAIEAGGESAFLAAVVEPIVESVGGLYGLLTARLPSQQVDERWHAAGADAEFWKQPTEDLLTSVLETATPCGRIYRARESGMTVGALAAPIRKPNGGCDGAVVVVAPCAGESEGRESQASLESLANLVSGLRSRFDEVHVRETAGQDLAGATHLSKVNDYATPRDLAFALTNNLRVRIGCDLVALGMGDRSRVELLSISGYDEIKVESPGVGQMQAAMEECLDAGEPMVAQIERESVGDALSSPYRLHRQWQEACGGAAVASIPIPIGEVRTAILSMRRKVNEPFSKEELEEVKGLVEPFLGALGLLERSARSLAEHGRDDLRRVAAAALAPGNVTRKAVAVMVAAFTIWAVFGSMPYRLSVPMVVRPEEARHVSAPHEAVLESIGVVPGDVVRAGDVMATFHHEELLLERDRLEAELIVEELGAREGMTGRNPLDVEMARARRNLLQAKISTVDERIAAATVRAPFDGQVVSGDLRKRIGERLPIGEPLFELSSGAVRLELEVPEYAAADVTTGQAGDFASHARPGDEYGFEIIRVAPQAVTRLGQSVYLAEASVAPDSSWMRPGLEGVAKVRVGDRSLVWALFHRLTDYLRLRFWL